MLNYEYRNRLILFPNNQAKAKKMVKTIEICESVVENEEKESDCQLSPAMDHQRVS